MSISGVLAGEFTHVVFKRLSAVEADRSRSNQHEFNAPKALREAFGTAQPRRIDTDFVWMPDDGEFVTERGDLTWYDSRARHPTRSEYRVYYRDNAVTLCAAAGALLLIALRPDGTVLLVLAPGTGLAAARISWLFGIEALPGSGFAALDIDPAAGRKLTSQLGMDYGQQSTGWEEEAEMPVVQSDDGIRREAAAAQDKVASVTVSEAQWDDIILAFPDPPPELAGAGFEHTIRGHCTKVRFAYARPERTANDTDRWLGDRQISGWLKAVFERCHNRSRLLKKLLRLGRGVGQGNILLVSCLSLQLLVKIGHLNAVILRARSSHCLLAEFFNSLGRL